MTRRRVSGPSNAATSSSGSTGGSSELRRRRTVRGIGAVTSSSRPSHAPCHATSGTETRSQPARPASSSASASVRIMAVVTGSQPIFAKPMDRPSGVKSWSTGVTKPDPPFSVAANTTGEARRARMPGGRAGPCNPGRRRSDAIRTACRRPRPAEPSTDQSPRAVRTLQGSQPVVREHRAGRRPPGRCRHQEVARRPAHREELGHHPASAVHVFTRESGVEPGTIVRSDDQLRERRCSPPVLDRRAGHVVIVTFLPSIPIHRFVPTLGVSADAIRARRHHRQLPTPDS